MVAFEEGIGTLLKIDAFAQHALGQPVVLVEADPRGKGEIRAHAHEHPTPTLVVNVKVVLHDPALRQLQMPAIRSQS